MTRKIKEMKDLEKRVVLCQIETVRDTFKKDASNDAKLTLLENTLHIVEQNRATLGKMKNMSSLEKNRIALNLIANVKHNEMHYELERQRVISKNLKHQEEIFNQDFYKKYCQKDNIIKNQSQTTTQIEPPKSSILSALERFELTVALKKKEQEEQESKNKALMVLAT
jgi:hypothetical protein